MQNTVSETITDFLNEVSDNSISNSSKDIFKICLADWISVSIAANDNNVSKVILSLLEDNKESNDSFVFGTKLYASPRIAALINGTISHALDYDDTHFDYLGHPSVVVISAALAIADKYKLNFNKFMKAVIIGMEVSCRIGVWLGRDHYRSGFHITSTAGIFGATIANSILLNLSKDKIINAIGIASSHSSGLKVQFGSMVKPYHVGMAASSSIEAVLLAKNGMISSSIAIDGDQGFGRTHNAEFNNDAFKSLGKKYIFENLTHKFHACCHGTHSTIEALLHLKNKFRIDVEDIDNISILIHPQYLNVCNILLPKTGLEAKFSYKMITSMVMNEINTSLVQSFSDEICRDENILSFMQIVDVYPSKEILETSSKVTIKTKSKKIFTYEYDLNNLKSINDRKNKMILKTSSLLGNKMSVSLWNLLENEEELPSNWIWNNYNKDL